MKFLKSTLGYLSGVKLIKKQLNYAKEDISSFSDNLGVYKQPAKTEAEKFIDDWNSFVIRNHVSAEMILTQYKKRRLVAYILFSTFLFSLYFIIVDARVSSGLAGCLISFIVYAKNALRLYQIRERNLCSWKDYFLSVKSSFREFFPLALPGNWQLMQVIKQVNTIKKSKRNNKINKKGEI